MTGRITATVAATNVANVADVADVADVAIDTRPAAVPLPAPGAVRQSPDAP